MTPYHTARLTYDLIARVTYDLIARVTNDLTITPTTYGFA